MRLPCSPDLGTSGSLALGGSPPVEEAVMGARDEGRGREAADRLRAEGIDARPVRLDVTDQATIAAARQVEAEFGRLDVLVDNAGIALGRVQPSQLDIDTLRRTFDTNFFGVFAVTKALLPLLRQSEAGRIVNDSS